MAEYTSSVLIEKQVEYNARDAITDGIIDSLKPSKEEIDDNVYEIFSEASVNDVPKFTNCGYRGLKNGYRPIDVKMKSCSLSYVDRVISVLVEQNLMKKRERFWGKQWKLLCLFHTKALKYVKPDREPVKENPVKRPLESAEDAKEQAKKLVKSGAIKLGDKKEKQEFKRSRNLEKKLQDPEKITASVSFMPFAAIHPQEKEEEREDRRARLPRIRGLYDTFVRGEKNVGPEREHRVDANMRDRSDREPLPKKGNTLYVRGNGVTEELLRKHFANFGNIVNIKMEKEKNCGFVTYDNTESSEMAMQEINCAMIDSIQLHVTMARRQPTFDATPHDVSKQSWGFIATNNSQKGSFKDQRDIVEYEDDIF